VTEGRRTATSRPAGPGATPGVARGERVALLALLLIVVVFPAAVLGYQFLLRPALSGLRTIDIVARAPEAGGFSPDAIRIAAGETVRLRFSVPDVTHGIAIGPGLGVDLGDVDPGQVKETRLRIDRPGRYTIYCNTWCSPSHWRMRATIEVYDPAEPEAIVPPDPPDPVMASLMSRGVNLDAPHDAPAAPAEPFDPARGARAVSRLGASTPADLARPEWQRSHSPAEAWSRLAAAGLAPADAWDAVAHLWLGGMGRDRLERATALFSKNCVACHGEAGDGHGPGADALAAQGIGRHPGMGHPRSPVAFARARAAMLGGTSERYYAKIRRGGMGTGMPAFGPLLTPDETWMLVDHVWTLVFGGAHGAAGHATDGSAGAAAAAYFASASRMRASAEP
jgi:mono/diheme cytochrome c family protein/plastocyanin